MGFLDRLLGRPPQDQSVPSAQSGQQGPLPADSRGTPQDSTTGATAQDRQAIARYRYLLRTAPPEEIEAAHAQAFERLTPSQRQQVLQEMTQTLPAGEQPQGADARQLARAATRAEMRQPGYLQSTFGGRGYAGGGMGGTGGGMMGAIGGSMLGTIAGVVIGTAVADTLLGGFDGSPEHQDLAAGGGDAGGADNAGDTGVDTGGDPGAGDPGGAGVAGDPGVGGGADPGGDPGFGDAGGDVGGGDFGGGDFGGGGDFF
jgi:hypothetical protein